MYNYFSAKIARCFAISLIGKAVSFALLGWLILTAVNINVRGQATDGAVDLTFQNPAVGNSVTSAAVQPNGKIIIGGQFSSVAGQTRWLVARLNADGSLDSTFQSSAADSFAGVHDLALQTDGKIIIGGGFYSYGGQPWQGLGRLNTDGSPDTSFQSPALSGSATAYAVALQPDGKILVGGAFTTIGGQPWTNIARLNPNGTVDATFQNPMLSGEVPFVQDIVLQPDGKIIIAGDFTSVSGQPRRRVARLNANGTLDTTFAPPVLAHSASVSETINDLALQQDGKIFIGGFFTSANGQERNNVARLNADGTLDAAFQSPAMSEPLDLIKGLGLQPDGKILIGGAFTSIGGQVRQNAARLNTDGTLDTTFQNPAINRTVWNFALQPDGKVVVVGSNFDSVGGQTRRSVARLLSSPITTCSYTLSPTAQNFPRTGGMGSISAVAPLSGCYRTAVSSASWLSITGGAAGNGSGTISYTVGINVLNSPRTAAISVGSQTFTVTQAASGIVNGQIVFVSQGGINGFGIYKMNADGSGKTQLTNQSNDTHPQWSTDGTKILFSRSLQTPPYTPNLYTMNADGTNQIRLTNGTGEDAPSWSPDGSKIVYLCYRNTGTYVGEICTMNANGTGETRLTFGGENETHPRWSPDGTKILYAETIGFSAIAVMNADGTNVVRLTDINYNYEPEWSPDGTKITYTTRRNSLGEIYIMNADGSNPVRLTASTLCDCSETSWSPDGTKIVFKFSPPNNGIYRIYTMNPDGTSRQALTTGQTSDSVPDWQALAVRSRNFPFDYDGDGKADVSVFRPSTGAWYLQQSTNGFTGLTFGFGTDKLVPADYDGDGKTDVAVYRSGTWYLQRSQAGFTGVAFGDSNDIPVPADYDGDGKADIAVFRPSNGTWYLLRSQLGFTGVQFGISTDKPVAADYDGDGKADIAVNRGGTWYINRSQLGFYGIQFGDANDKLVPADYDGDGKIDVAVFRPSNGVWYLQQSTNGFTGIAFGLGTDTPVAADYDGDGKADVAVFRSGTWYLNRSTAGFTGVAFGASTDQPLPNVFVR